MGVILSAVAVATNSIKKSCDKKKVKKTREAYGPQDTSAASQPYSQKQGDAVEGLRDEHLASVPPLSQGTEGLEGAGTAQVERDVAVKAPLPVAATS